MIDSVKGTFRAVVCTGLLACLPLMFGCRAPSACGGSCSGFSCEQGAQFIPDDVQAKAHDKLQQANHQLELATEATR